MRALKFNDLPEDIQQKYLANSGGSYDLFPHDFIWNCTKEGHMFWGDVLYIRDYNTKVSNDF